jgi:hypothetical protein
MHETGKDTLNWDLGPRFVKKIIPKKVAFIKKFNRIEGLCHEYPITGRLLEQMT